jgi:Thioesterase domain/Phosphopantetheine attachment site
VPPESANQGNLREPRTHHEEVIRNIFGEVLALPPAQIGIDVSFFALGGQSRLAARLAGRISTAFSTELPLRSMFEHGTVERLAQEIDELTKRVPQGKPLALRPNGRGVPIFCIHPSSGFGRPYRGLLRYLEPEIPVYALEARGINDGDTLPATLQDMCADYIDQIQDLQPNGPYRLLGWSFGAIPAHAIAVEMQRRGLDVGGLIMIDGYPFDGSPWLDGLVASHRAYWEKEILSYRDVRDAPAELKVSILDRLCAIKRNNIQLQLYRDPARFPGDALLIKSNPSGRGGGSNPFPWNRYVSGELLEVIVPFGHNVLLSPDVAAVYASQIVDYLDRPAGS